MPCSSVSTYRITVETLGELVTLTHFLLCEPTEGAGLSVCEATRRALNRPLVDREGGLRVPPLDGGGGPVCEAPHHARGVVGFETCESIGGPGPEVEQEALAVAELDQERLLEDWFGMPGGAGV